MVFFRGWLFLSAWRLCLSFIPPETRRSAETHRAVPRVGGSIDRFWKESSSGRTPCISIRQKLSCSSREKPSAEIMSLLGLLSPFVPGAACWSHLSRVRENLVSCGRDHVDNPLDDGNKTLPLGAIFHTLFVALSSHPLMRRFSLVSFYLWEKERRLN